ncbi:MAG: DUF2721 domain-containing protein [Saprospiraceae bacterium]|jgi:hypothetical protein|uniref:DUF2721 domain-containing protein n=1 Tax=Candidatus Brachybacter algidus TaxID=2982024 RepID=UPI001B60CC28|nr:DUF2721 domain-containing protein [Candidatus Brachybacter algidus]MBP7305674.1 DUF2721 domain-containing protein [Saprospiraceae bacterium]MBK6373493.1 DUF2721 domain-containing protein [Candidatus Brachybacter algidus]MBK6449478.1 DUF2721 domain-containing protein [Candidatus Brachybacter algidus]MBK7604632.1 DUF2721 domain-containing protein [Candidatus Brachybacter algidus]MBK8602345.1 DUF2721 domain-containing protein [Candidatus Brachybacter algidus]
MDLNISTPGLIFPSISFLLIAYSNRFLAIAQLIRDLKNKFSEKKETILIKQIKNLRYRLKLIRWMQGVAVFGMLLALLSIMTLYLEYMSLGNIFFILSAISVTTSLSIALVEIMFSGRALDLDLEDIQDHLKEKKKYL